MQYKKHSLILVFSLVFLMAMSSCDQNAPKAPPKPMVTQTEIAQKVTHSKGSITASGVIVPISHAQLSFAQSGWVQEVNVEANQLVEEGQALVMLEGSQRLEAAVIAAQADVLAAQQVYDKLFKDINITRSEAYHALVKANESVGVTKRFLYYLEVPVNRRDLPALEGLAMAVERLEKARLAYEPYKKMDDRDLSLLKKNRDPEFKAADDELEWAQSDYNNALRRLELESALFSAQANLEEALEKHEILQQGPDPDDVAIAQAHLEKAEANLEVAKASLDQLALRSPFPGTVVKVDIYPGESVIPGQVVITLGDLEHLWVETSDLSERDVSEVLIGQQAFVYIEALSLEVGGQVVDIAPQANTIGGDVVYTVTIALDEQPEGLRWGMSVDVEIITED